MYKHNSEILNQSNIALFTILWQQNDLKLLKKLVEMIIESMKLYPLDKYLQHKSIVMLVVLAETCILFLFAFCVLLHFIIF